MTLRVGDEVHNARDTLCRIFDSGWTRVRVFCKIIYHCIVGEILKKRPLQLGQRSHLWIEPGQNRWRDRYSARRTAQTLVPRKNGNRTDCSLPAFRFVPKFSGMYSLGIQRAAIRTYGFISSCRDLIRLCGGPVDSSPMQCVSSRVPRYFAKPTNNGS
jgi:hypothetical protein